MSEKKSFSFFDELGFVKYLEALSCEADIGTVKNRLWQIFLLDVYDFQQRKATLSFSEAYEALLSEVLKQFHWRREQNAKAWKAKQTQK